MIPTKEDLEKLELKAKLYNELDKYVYLREDENGRYIEYAFIDGAPHDNRCLSWYDKPHPKTLMKKPYNYTKEMIEKSINRLHKIGELYELSEYSCGYENKEGDEKCCAGSPKKDCVYAGEDWDYDEPIKCACWFLSEPHIPTRVSIPIKKALEIKNILLN
jgi:hypothetical protein